MTPKEFIYELIAQAGGYREAVIKFEALSQQVSEKYNMHIVDAAPLVAETILDYKAEHPLDPSLADQFRQRGIAQ